MAEAQEELTDAEKHVFAQRRGYPHAVFLWPSIYDRAKAAGYIDMRLYIRQKPMPPGQASHGRVGGHGRIGGDA